MTQFDVILADPPWPYKSPRALVGNAGRGNDGGRAAAIIQADVGQHYATMSIDQIKGLPVGRITKPAAFLFLWVTNPFLAEGVATDVAHAWGFTPKTVVTWAKVQTDQVTPSMKTGHWFRSASEHVLFGVRGKVRRPQAYAAIPTWFAERRLPHSCKPARLYELAEAVAPDGRYLEMFARRNPQRTGWDVWGDEVAGWCPRELQEIMSLLAR